MNLYRWNFNLIMWNLDFRSLGHLLFSNKHEVEAISTFDPNLSLSLSLSLTHFLTVCVCVCVCVCTDGEGDYRYAGPWYGSEDAEPAPAHHRYPARDDRWTMPPVHSSLCVCVCVCVCFLSSTFGPESTNF